MNGIIVIDKPSGWTSHDVVGKLRGIFHEKRIGHGGTLDPMATGVLPVFVGRATRAVQFCENAEKRYRAALRPGVSTDTQDITGTVLRTSEAEFTEERLREVLQSFTGPLKQIPPMYSAVKVGGKKLYELARRGETVERKAREIDIMSLEYLGRTEDGDYMLDVLCSKGTYIRTLCSDIGDALGCGGTLSYLRRMGAGIFSEEDAVTIKEVEEAAASGCLDGILRPVDSLFSNLEKTVAEGSGALAAVYNGGCYKTSLPDGKYRVYDGQGCFLMLGLAENGTMKTIKSFFEVK